MPRPIGPAAALLAGLALLALLTLPACIQVGAGDPPPPIRRHALDAADLEANASRALPSVGVTPFHGRERYDLRVVARDGAGALEFLAADRWVDDPRHAVTIAVTEMLGSSGAFTSATDAGAGFETELLLEGHVLVFDLVRGAGEWEARLRLRLDLADADGRIVHSGTYDASRALPGASSEGLGPAMSANVAEILGTALARWRERL